MDNAKNVVIVIHILEFNSATALVIRYFHSIGFYICIELYSLIISLDSCQRQSIITFNVAQVTICCIKQLIYTTKTGSGEVIGFISCEFNCKVLI